MKNGWLWREHAHLVSVRNDAAGEGQQERTTVVSLETRKPGRDHPDSHRIVTPR
jgi:hypothetical protein